MSVLQVPRTKCKNNAVIITGDIMDIPDDVDILTYTDERGNIWCFEIEEIPYLLRNKKNPWTRGGIPESFILFLQRYMMSERYNDMLKKLQGYKKGEENIDTNTEIRRKKDAINEILSEGATGEGDDYISVDQFLDIIQKYPNYTVFPSKVDRDNRASIVNFLYNNRRVKLRQSINLIYMIVKLAYLNNEGEENNIEQIKEYKRTLDEYFHTNFDTLFKTIVRDNNVEELKALKNRGYSAEDIKDKVTVLYALTPSAEEGRVDMLKALRDFGVTLDMSTDNGILAFQRAVVKKRLDVLKVLREDYGMDRYNRAYDFLFMNTKDKAVKEELRKW